MHSRSQTPRGVALVAVLAVLTTLAILASVFAIYMQLEQRISRVSRERMQADLLAQSALQHALTMLRHDAETAPGWNSLDEPWARMPAIANDDGWFYVRNEFGDTIGRYAINIEDEAGKINVNAASAVGTGMQNMGFGTFEIMLTGPDNRGLPITVPMAANIMRYRYGRDMRPGQANVDDNYTASLFAFDRIDNTGDGRVDPPGEGIDDPTEYNPANPVWDDRVFASIHDVVQEMSGGAPFSQRTVRQLKRYATTHSRSYDTYYDRRAGVLRPRININVADRRQISQIFRRGNQEHPFEGSSRNLQQMIANVIDYRDENHVLSTVGSEYGIEAICFNEVLSNDGGYSHEPDWSGWGIEGNAGADAQHVLCNNYFYGRVWGNTQYRFLWQLANVAHVGEGTRIRLGRPQRDVPRLNVFMQMDTVWPANLWKNSEVEVEAHGPGGARRQMPVISSPRTTQREVIIGTTADDKAWLSHISTNFEGRTTVRLYNHWHHGPTMFNGYPEETEIYWHPVPRDRRDLYFRVYLMGQCFPPNDWWGSGPNMRSLMWEMDVDGDPEVYSVQEAVRNKWVYKDGEAVRANRQGYIPVVVTTSRNTRGRPGDYSRGKNDINWQYANYFNTTLFYRPDIVELTNISDQPISLRNWGVVVNTGLDANLLARIDYARHYSTTHGGRYDNPNPTVQPGGHFYLTNNREIFALEYGGGTRVYGSSRTEEIPVFELPESEWGIEYRVREVSGRNITVEGADWRANQLRGELVEYLSDRQPSNRNPPDGEIKVIQSNTRNTLQTEDAQGYGLQAGDRVRIVGLPRQGGFVSFTLKNEYDQVTARMVDYGSVEENQIGYSMEKFDPTHHTWIPNSRPTISGTERLARNRRMPEHEAAMAYVKNNPFVSIGEIQRVRKASDWENIGMARGGQASVDILKAIGDYFSTYGHRMGVEEEGAHREGWRPAFGTVRSSQGNVLVATESLWQADQWRGHSLRITSGPLAGERFAVISSTANSVTVDGYSVPSGRTLRVEPGTTFTVGPGYATPFFYTTREGEEGIWEWENKGLEKIPYALYIYGLNDAIDTTEFLEENFNAQMEVSAFNFTTREYDTLPLPRDAARDADDPYARRGARRVRYEKSDSVYCGMISPDHISPRGGVRLKIRASQLNHPKSSGMAWFNYAYLTPAVTYGKININTASPRVLSALRHITPARAMDIYRGVDNFGNARLKPYRRITDLLDVRGITPAIFQDIVNLITVRSDQFRVTVRAEVFDDVSGNGRFDEENGDSILSSVDMDVLVDRSQLTDGNPDTSTFMFNFQN